jgi:transcriptional regulator GlxA family with amidase domain
MTDVTIIVLESTLPSTAIIPLEIFASTGVIWQMLRGLKPDPQFRTHAVSIDGRPTRHAVPIRVVPQGSLRDVKRTDLIVVPSAEYDLDTALAANAPLIPWLRRMHARGVAIAGVCTGAALLAEAGILDGRLATTHWAVEEVYRRRYPRVRWQTERFVTESHNVFCGGGVYAAIDLSLYLVEAYCGHEAAVQTAKALLLETPRIWQASYAVHAPHTKHDDEPIQKTQTWMFRNFRENLGVDELAARAGMSPRNFARRFKAATGENPLGYLHRVRIDAARHLLESKAKSIAEISSAVGYQDQNFFRRLFQRYAGIAPRAYRARFGPDATRTRRRKVSSRAA